MTKDQAKKIIQNFCKNKVIDIALIEGRGEVNQIFIVTTSKIKYILRVDENENIIDRFQKEAWCAKVANIKGILTPEVFKFDLESGQPYMIETYIEGINGDQSTQAEKDKIWRTLGEYARQSRSIPTKGYGDKMSAPGIFNDSWSRYLEYNITSLTPDDKAIKCGAITAKESKIIKNIFVGLKNIDFEFGLSHYDLSLKNTIITPAGKVYLLDWGSAQVGPIPHLDISEILDESLNEKSKQFKIFLDGYGISYDDYKKMKMEITWLELLINMDKLRWALDKKNDRVNNFSKKIKAVLKKLR